MPIVAYRLRKHAVIDMATIERRGDVGGFVSSIPPEDQFVQWRTEREIDVMTALASLAGERMFFDGDHSMGVGGDMNAATAMTTQALAFYAMGDTLASRSVTLAGMRGAQALETGADRAMFDSQFGHSVEEKLGDLYERTWDLLQEHRGEVLALGHALETEKTITGDDVAAIIEGTVGPTVDGQAVPRSGVPTDARALPRGRAARPQGARRRRGAHPGAGATAARRRLGGHRWERAVPAAAAAPTGAPVAAAPRRRVADRLRLDGKLRPCACTTPCRAGSTTFIPSPKATSRCTRAGRRCTGMRTWGTCAPSCSAT